MEFGLASFGLSFAAGGLSILSPCVLPLMPILLGAALAAHRLGPLALASGVCLSFTLVGTLIASLGLVFGIDQGHLRSFAAILLLGWGAVLLSARLQAGFAIAASSLSGAGQTWIAHLTFDGLPGQFLLGLLLGLAWSPCVGPTLGAAVTLASQGQSLPLVALMMASFGLGAGLPLAGLGLLSRQAAIRTRSRLLVVGELGKRVLGGIMLTLGTLILSGVDKSLETLLLQAAPSWLLQLTTSF